jgi:hypothetical protein
VLFLRVTPSIPASLRHHIFWTTRILIIVSCTLALSAALFLGDYLFACKVRFDPQPLSNRSVALSVNLVHCLCSEPGNPPPPQALPPTLIPFGPRVHSCFFLWDNARILIKRSTTRVCSCATRGTQNTRVLKDKPLPQGRNPRLGLETWELSLETVRL